MAKKKTTPKPPTLGGYTKKMDEAIKALALAQTYAEDGAQLGAIGCAARAIGLLEDASRQRRAFLNAPEA